MRIAIFILILAVTGCATQKRCQEKWPPEITPIDTVKITTVKDTIIYRDTTVTITIPADTVRDTVVIHKNIKAYGTDSVTVETDLARATAWIEHTDKLELRIQLEQKQTDLQVQLDSAIQQRDRFSQELTTIKQTYTKPVYKPSPWHRFTASGFWILAVIVIFYLVLTFMVLRKR